MYFDSKKPGRPTSLHGRKVPRSVTLTDEVVKRMGYLAEQMQQELQCGPISLSNLIETTFHRLYEEDYQRRFDAGEPIECED